VDVNTLPETAKGSDFIKHFGVKGMHWGVRRGRNGESGPSEVGVKMRAGKRLKVSGGKNHPAHQDAINAAIAKQKARKSSTDALSTHELQNLVNRMNLEQQFARLNGSEKSTVDVGQDYVKKALAAGKTVNDITTFVNSPAGKLIKASLKTAIQR
jgi:hypothetical protein